MSDMRRRQFITLLGGAAAAWPLAARAQRPAMPVIGFLHHAWPDQFAILGVAFRQGLKEAGFVEGQNVAIEYRWAEDHHDRLPSLAADLVRRQVAVIVVNTPSMAAAKAATATIPIVFVSADDPVAAGLAASFNRPGGNATGVYFLITALEGKRLELLRELAPKTSLIAALVNPDFPSAESQSREMQQAARALGFQLLIVKAGTESELDTAFVTLVRERVGALAVASDGFFFFRRERITAFAAAHRLPTIFPQREAAVAGGLMSYGTSVPDAYRQGGIYVGRILKGEKPSDLPVQQSVKVELAINMKTANALGVTFPLSLLGRADEVIE
jgi:putative tryptophan/tyrosine transport system substrate-binding protein